MLSYTDCFWITNVISIFDIYELPTVCRLFADRFPSVFTHNNHQIHGFLLYDKSKNTSLHNTF
jgi:hypothetical protein